MLSFLVCFFSSVSDGKVSIANCFRCQSRSKTVHGSFKRLTKHSPWNVKIEIICRFWYFSIWPFYIKGKFFGVSDCQSSPWGVRNFLQPKLVLQSSRPHDPFCSVVTATTWPILLCYSDAESWPDVAFRFRLAPKKSGQHVNGNGKNWIPIFGRIP